jgi:cytochrome P450
MRRSSRKGDLLSQLILLDAPDGPAGLALYDRIRSGGPAYKGTYGLVTANLLIVKEVLTSNDFRAGVETEEGAGVFGRLTRWAGESGAIDPRRPPSLLVTEPPDHTRYRKLLTRVFSVRAVEALRAQISAVACELLDDIERQAVSGQPIEVVSRYCTLLPLTIISEILGVPDHEHGLVRGFGARGAASLDFGLGWRKFRATERSLVEFDVWLSRHVDRLRQASGEDLFSQLVHATDDGGLNDHELKSTGGLLLAAGFETTVNLLGNGIALLASHPDELARLREDDSLWPNAVEEVLRYDPPVPITDRSAVRNTMLGDLEVSAGMHVTLLLGGANRDPAVFERASQFEVARENAREHVSFAAGRHFCLGSALARLQGDIGLRLFFERFGHVEVADGVRRRPTRTLRGYAEVPVVLKPAA